MNQTEQKIREVLEKASDAVGYDLEIDGCDFYLLEDEKIIKIKGRRIGITNNPEEDTGWLEDKDYITLPRKPVIVGLWVLIGACLIAYIISK